VAKVLMVVMEVSFLDINNGFRNRSMNVIINEYRKHFSKVVVFCPGFKDGAHELDNGVVVESVARLTPGLVGKLKFYYGAKQEVERFRSLIKKYSVDLVQFRIPSLFSMRFARLNNIGVDKVFYIGGDWEASLKLNYPHPFIGVVAKHFSVRQNAIVKGEKIVTAGPVLAARYTQLSPSCFAYYSTTHADSTRYQYSDKTWLAFCCVGRLEPLKSFKDAILAIELLKDRYELNPVLYICGEGKERCHLERIISEKGLEDNVKLLGVMGEDSLKEIYQECAFLIHPSLSEGTPKVLPEAMSHGCIPIAVRGVGSVDFIIQDGLNGFLVEPNSPTEIAQKIHQVLSSKNMQDSLLEGAFNYAQEHTIENEVKGMWSRVLG